jgi:hypothetical protein
MVGDVLEDMGEVFSDVPPTLTAAAIQNFLQAMYHLVRLDLGVIHGNQIYNSPDAYNRTIVLTPLDYSGANTTREFTSDSESMAQFQKQVEFFQITDRVPVMEYLQPVPHLKPLGSAITSVFVSTFAMLSAMSTIFSLVAGALAQQRTGKFLAAVPSPCRSLIFIKLARTSRRTRILPPPI